MIKYDVSQSTILRWIQNFNCSSNITITKEELENLYIKNQLSAGQIAKIKKTNTTNIYNLLSKFQLKKNKIPFIISKEKLYDLYIIQHLTQTEIAKKYNVSRKVIERTLNKYNIKEAFSNRYRTSYIPTKEELYKYYITDDLTYKEINKKYGITYIVFKELCKKYNIRKYSNKANTDIISDFTINSKTVNEIAKENHCRISKISKILKENNINFISKSSKYEKNIFNLYNKLNSISNSRILDGKEIDIYIPEKKIGIKFNGNYLHNELYKKENYHYEKSKLAEEKGIFLYHIFEHEWLTKQDKIINQLNNLLGLNDTKIYARKCEIREVNKNEKRKFLNLNHLQGNDKCKIAIGLYYQDELVSLMTFCKPRFNKKYEWELSRFCCKANCSIIGGASKLFKYFVNEFNPINILSYSDIAKTKGNLYNVLGFTFDHIAEPNYVWHKSNMILTRYQCQKHKLLALGYVGSSEVEIMRERGYNRLYDAGNKVWVWKN